MSTTTTTTSTNGSSSAAALPIRGRTVLVTGGAGFIGCHVVRLLIEAGAAVRCLLRPTTNAERLAGLAVERREGDVRDPAVVRAAIEGCDAVVHLAALTAWDKVDSAEAGEVLLGGVRNVLEAALAGGLKKVVFVSSLTAVNASDQPTVFDESATFELAGKGLRYAENKHAAEAVCREFVGRGLPVVIVNPAETYGPNDITMTTAKNLVDAIKTTPLVLWDGGTAVAHVDDVALGVVRALERGRPGERYILAGDNLTIRQIAEMVLEIAGKKKTIVMVPTAVIRGVAKGARALRLPFPIDPGAVIYGSRYWFADSSKAQRELGVAFRSARETFASTIGWLKETGRLT